MAFPAQLWALATSCATSGEPQTRCILVPSDLSGPGQGAGDCRQQSLGRCCAAPRSGPNKLLTCLRRSPSRHFRIFHLSSGLVLAIAMSIASTDTSSAFGQPRCTRCHGRSAVLHIVKGRLGYQHWTLRCRSCSLVYETQMASDPMKSDVQRWIDGELITPK